ncbi:ZP domain-containing protein [Trichostrongylus colubriformis]|uniref:ZP domain-containing protein n=1 Tax=Trichostrongylus colubriformis TaxID=6319 RepID=A0AAN8EUC9_TRICO
MFLAVILHTMFLFLTAQSIPIDNGVEGEPEIECGSTAITVNFNTRNNFEGYVYVKPHFLTKVDHAYRVSCFYMETIEDVSSRLDVSELTTASVTGAVQMPVCRYDILDGGVHGNPVPYGKIGQQVYHRWSCTTQSINTFCMLVHSCSVDDGKGDRVNILDANGCAIDRYVLNNIEYPDDLLAGQEAHVYKYADRSSLFYECQISIQVKEKGECRRPVCPDLLNSSPSRVFSKFQQATGSVHSGGPRTFTTSRPLFEPAYAQSK